MTPDFTLIWPLNCLKDGVHLSHPSDSSASWVGFFHKSVLIRQFSYA